jgi:hypothetical protein
LGYGLPHHSSYIPPYRRAELIRKLISCNLTHIHVGNLNCRGQLEHTRETLLEVKDEKYGERILGASVLTPIMANSFLTTGADELIIPVDLRFPFPVESCRLLEPEIRTAMSNGYSVRLQIDGIMESTDEQLSDIIEFYNKLNITYISILDSDGLCTPAYLSLLLKPIKDRVFHNHIALGFKDDQLTGLANIHTAIEEGITTFHTTISGLGGYIGTSKLIRYATEMNLNHPVNDLNQLHQVEKWWNQLY